MKTGITHLPTGAGFRPSAVGVKHINSRDVQRVPCNSCRVSRQGPLASFFDDVLPRPSASGSNVPKSVCGVKAEALKSLHGRSLGRLWVWGWMLVSGRGPMKTGKDERNWCILRGQQDDPIPSVLQGRGWIVPPMKGSFPRSCSLHAYQANDAWRGRGPSVF